MKLRMEIPVHYAQCVCAIAFAPEVLHTSGWF